MPPTEQGTCGMLSSSLEAVTVLYYTFLDVVWNGEQKAGKAVAQLPARQSPQQPCGVSRKPQARVGPRLSARRGNPDRDRPDKRTGATWQLCSWHLRNWSPIFVKLSASVNLFLPLPRF